MNDTFIEMKANDWLCRKVWLHKDIPFFVEIIDKMFDKCDYDFQLFFSDRGA